MSMKEKLAVTVLVTTLALFGLVVVLYRMIKDKNEDYTQIVLNQHSSYDSRTIPYRRGDIVDRNGTYLATSEKVYNLILDPNQINQDKENYLEPTVSALCEVFGYDRADILATISANENSYYVPYEKQISADKKEEFETKKKELNDAYAKSKEDSGKKIKGVWFEDELPEISVGTPSADGFLACGPGIREKTGRTGNLHDGGYRQMLPRKGKRLL